MKALLDTNILIHREAGKVVNEEIGTLFNWLDRLHYEKCIHPLSIVELEKHLDPAVVKTIQTKLKHYNTLTTAAAAPETEEIVSIRNKYDGSMDDSIATSLLKELFCNRVDCLITEDRKIHVKAIELGLSNLVFTIDDFLEKLTAENPALADYKVLSVKKEYFVNINVHSPFFDSFREDYKGFDDWFNKKSGEVAYICQSASKEILAFLYVKKEGIDESYLDMEPILPPRLRLKIGTFKVVSNGYKLGERFLKVVFDNALRNNVEEVYMTLFHKRDEHERLIGLIEDWGFKFHGLKKSTSGVEKVFVKDFNPIVNSYLPKKTYPFISRDCRYFIVPIYPEYHTELLPDSILNNETPQDYVENEPYRNAIQKVYISRSFFRALVPGDVLIFYRTGGVYKSVLTTIGIVDSVVTDIKSEADFIKLCRKRSVFDDAELKKHWNWNVGNRPFVVNFLYLYSFPKRPNLHTLIKLDIIKDVNSAPRGFEQISIDNFEKILKVTETNENFIVN